MAATRIANKTFWGLLLIATVVAGIASLVFIDGGPLGVYSADHLDGPVVGTDGRTDIGDLYVFHPQIGDAGEQDHTRTVLALTVNPAAGVISGTGFDSAAHYEFLVDQNGDAIEDLVYRVRVAPGNVVLTWRIVGNSEPELISIGQVGAVGFGLGSNSYAVRTFAGLRDDPFYLDLNAFNAGAAFCQGEGGTGSNFFAGFNSSAIVLSLPTDWVGDGAAGVWARTMAPDAEGAMKQVDRAGRPAISTVFIPPNPFEPSESSLKTSYNTSHPKDDVAKFRAEIVDSLTFLHSLNDASDITSDDAGKVSGLADILLPDILTVDLSQDTGFLNGRGLADDVMDAELGLITEGAITTDCVDNDSTFSDAFPYLGKPN